jgi:hypothetical protein
LASFDCFRRVRSGKTAWNALGPVRSSSTDGLSLLRLEPVASSTNSMSLNGSCPGERAVLEKIVFDGTSADLIAARATLTGEHLAAYADT